MSDYLQDRLVAAVGDHYLIEAEIGRGGMAAVYKALDLRLHRHVAIKLLPPDLAFNADVKTRFLREAQMSAQLNHPNIVPIYSVDERDGVVYFVMALVEGETLAQQLGRSPHCEIDQVRRVIGDVADALDYAHKKGVVHRDVKPDNIMLDRASGRTMVTDFGIARAAAGDSRLTVTGVAVGTPAYMSPEQALGERDVDGRSDIYSLGVVAYQMLAGEQPFKASNTPAMLMKHVSEVPPPLRLKRPDAPAAIIRAVDVALSKKPEDRWPDGASFAAAMRAASPAEPPIQPPRVDQLRDTGAIPSVPPAPLPRVELPGRVGASGFAGLYFQLPPTPRSADREAWRKWKDELRERAHDQRDVIREQVGLAREARREARRDRGRGSEPRTLEERISRFRKLLISNVAIVGMLAVINNLTFPYFQWWLFPAIAMGAGTLIRAGSLWSDGVSLRQIFSRGVPPGLPPGRTAAPPAQPALPAPAPLPPDPPLASSDVLAGPHGQAVRRANGDRIVIREVLAKLTATERKMLPEIEPVVTALSERVGSLATTLHRLDADVSGANLGALDQRIAELKKEPETMERDRRIGLLERQRTTLHDLLDRRRTMMSQFESACLALQNLKLDLLKLRSAGVDAALNDVSTATQEARTLSREIGHAIEAADEVRRL